MRFLLLFCFNVHDLIGPNRGGYCDSEEHLFCYGIDVHSDACGFDVGQQPNPDAGQRAPTHRHPWVLGLQSNIRF